MKYPRDVYYRMRPRRYAVLRALSMWERQHPVPPTIREFAGVMGRSGPCVHEHLRRLVEDKLVSTRYGKYAVTKTGKKYLYEVSYETD